MAFFSGLWKGVRMISGGSSDVSCLSLIALRRLSNPTLLPSIISRRVEGRVITPMLGICPCQVREFAARRSTREKWYKIKRARKLQAAVKKVMEPSKWIKTSKTLLPSRIRTSLYAVDQEPIDDVYFEQFFRRQLHPIGQAIEMHRETHHPTVYNQPDAPLFLSLELDMSLEKKTKFLDTFTDIAPILHAFDDRKVKTILAFCKKEQDQAIALEAGADIAGGMSLIKQVQAGEVLLGEYKYIVCHGDILVDLNPIRGVLKKRFPNVGKGSVGMNMQLVVERFKKGLEYSAEKDTIQHNFGWIDVQVGTLDMPSEQLEANIASVVTSACTHRPPKLGPFVTVALLLSPPSKEKITINVGAYMPIIEEEDSDDEGDVSGKSFRKQ